MCLPVYRIHLLKHVFQCGSCLLRERLPEFRIKEGLYHTAGKIMSYNIASQCQYIAIRDRPGHFSGMKRLTQTAVDARIAVGHQIDSHSGSAHDDSERILAIGDTFPDNGTRLNIAEVVPGCGICKIVALPGRKNRQSPFSDEALRLLHR